MSITWCFTLLHCRFFFCSLLEQIDWVIYLVASVLVAGIPSFIFYKKDKAFK